MPRILPLITTAQLHGLKPKSTPYFKNAGGGTGLYLKVTPTGDKSWCLRDPETRAFKVFGLAGIGGLSISEAVSLATGGDNSAISIKSPLPNFKRAAIDFIEANETKWRNPKSQSQWLSSLTEYAFPVIGHIAVDKITAQQVIKILENIGERLDTAKKVRGRIQQIIDATFITLRTGEPYANPAEAKVIKYLKPSIIKPIKRNHHAAIEVEKAPAAFKELMLKRKKNVSYAALCFTILTAARSGEVRHAEWSDIQESEWCIPAEKMKAGKDHVVPLSKQALQILKERNAIDGEDGYIFPNGDSNPLSDMSLLQSLKRSCGAYTVHGWRSTFSSWATEQGASYLVVETCLSHTVGTAVERSYRRTPLLKERKVLLQQWADYLIGGE